MTPTHRRHIAVPQEELLVVVAAYLAMLGLLELSAAVILVCGYC